MSAAARPAASPPTMTTGAGAFFDFAAFAALVLFAGTARPLTTDRAIIASSVLMVEILFEQLRVLGAGIERVEHQLADVFATHPDRAIFQSFPGAGKALAPRLLAAWGSDRQRFPTAANMQCFAGPAPVTVRSEIGR